MPTFRRRQPVVSTASSGTEKSSAFSTYTQRRHRTAIFRRSVMSRTLTLGIPFQFVACVGPPFGIGFISFLRSRLPKTGEIAHFRYRLKGSELGLMAALRFRAPKAALLAPPAPLARRNADGLMMDFPASRAALRGTWLLRERLVRCGEALAFSVAVAQSRIERFSCAGP